MKIDDLNKCFDAVTPSESCKERMLYNVLSSKNTVKTTFSIFRRCCAVLAAVVFIAGISYGYTKINNLGTNNIAANVSDNTGENSDYAVSDDGNTSDTAMSSEETSKEMADSERKNTNSVKKSEKKNVNNSAESKQTEAEPEINKSLDKNIIVAQAGVVENSSPMVARNMPQEDNAASGGGRSQAQSSEIDNEISVASVVGVGVDVEEEEEEKEEEDEDEEKDETTAEEETQTAE